MPTTSLSLCQLTSSENAVTCRRAEKPTSVRSSWRCITRGRRERGGERGRADEQRHALADAARDREPGEAVAVGQANTADQERERARGGAARQQCRSARAPGQVAGPGRQQRERERAAEDAEHRRRRRRGGGREVEQVDEQRARSRRAGGRGRSRPRVEGEVVKRAPSASWSSRPRAKAVKRWTAGPRPVSRIEA